MQPPPALGKPKLASHARARLRACKILEYLELDRRRENLSCEGQNPMPTQAQLLKRRIDQLAHSLALSKAIGAAAGLGKRKRDAIRQLHFTDIRESVGEEFSRSNPRIKGRTKREMRVRAEHTGAQRVMRQRQRDILAAEQELERFIIEADADYDAQAQGTNDAP